MHERSKQRVKELGEVFTPPAIANQMIDMLDQEKFLECKFFEPTCGNGNIFIEGLRRKLNLAFDLYYKDKHPHETALRWSIAYSVSTSFAADIMLDNVIECRERSKKLITDWFNEKMGVPSVHVLSSFSPVFELIDINIQHADCLAGICKTYEEAKEASLKTKASRDFFEKFGWVKIHFGEEEKQTA